MPDMKTHCASAPSHTTSRRDFLKSTGSAALLGSFASAAGGLGSLLGAETTSSTSAMSAKALVGSNVYGWSQYAQRDQKPLDVDQVLSALRDAGYDYLENFMDLARPESNLKFAEQLKSKGLQPVSLYTGARLHESAKADEVVDRLLAAAKVIQPAGFKVISCNPDPIGREKTDGELATQAKALTRLGEGLNQLGLHLGVHHHMPEMANQAREFHFNFRQTPPRAVGFCYDVHWVWKGGVMPMDALEAYGERVVTWHLRQSRQRVWTEILEDGDVDYSAVATYAAAHHLPRRFTVELALEGGTKVTRSAAENHRLSREYVRRVFGA